MEVPESRLRVVSAVVIVVALALRVQGAMGTFLNADEVLHVVLSNQHTAAEAYRASLTNAHPPLFFLVLHFWRWIGTSEVAFRMTAVLAGTGAAWIASRWAAAVMGPAAGLATLLMLSFSPFLIMLNAELRPYSLLLLWMSAALWWVERMLRTKSPGAGAWTGLFLALAALTHYSAAWFVAALGVYVLLRLKELPRVTALAWAGTQIAIAALYGVLYVTHLSKIHGSAMEAEAADGWLRSLYFRPDAQSVPGFVVAGTEALFQVLFSHRYLGLAALLLCLAGGLWIMFSGVRRLKPEIPAAFGMLLFLPFAFNATGGLLRVYPYGGSRHCVFLILFAAAGAALSAAKIVRERAMALLAIAVVLAPYWHWRALPAPQQVARSQQEKALMTQAVAYLRESAPAGAAVVTDYQSSLLFTYYVGGGATPPASTSCGGYTETAIGGYRMITSPRWSDPGADFLRDAERWRTTCGGGPVWVFDGGWGENLIDDLARGGSAAYSRERRFGPALAVFQFGR